MSEINPRSDRKQQKVHLDRRLKTVASFVRLDKRIADIGTDHAFIPCFLYRQGARALFACDILEGPLACARATMELYGIPEKKLGSSEETEGITVIRCDGLEEVPPVDDVIIAGMGGEMIANIISRCKFLNGDLHFILQPMTRDWVLRRELYRTGLYIEEEKTASVSGKIYTVMLCLYDGVKREIDDKFAFIGKNRDREYLQKQLALLEKMGKGKSDFLSIKNEILQDLKAL